MYDIEFAHIVLYRSTRALFLVGRNFCQEPFNVFPKVNAIVVERVPSGQKLAAFVPVAEGESGDSDHAGRFFYR